jgi:hypothetical protein
MASAVWGEALDLIFDPKPAHARERHHIAAIFCFRKLIEPPSAADRMQARFTIPRLIRLHHADQPALSFHAILNHTEKPRLEDVQWQFGTRQKQRSGQGKDGDHIRHIEFKSHDG